MKCCPKCGIDKPFSGFGKNVTTKDGLQVWCRSCRTVGQRADRAKLDYARDAARRKVCPDCGKEKTAFEFHRSRISKDGLQRVCKPCLNERSNARFKANPALRRAPIEKYRKNRPEVIVAGTAVTNAIRVGRLKKLPCERCGAARVHAHHHISYEARHHLDVIWLCAGCHADWHATFGPVQ
jgi:hypothetical protein